MRKACGGSRCDKNKKVQVVRNTISPNWPGEEQWLGRVQNRAESVSNACGIWNREEKAIKLGGISLTKQTDGLKTTLQVVGTETAEPNDRAKEAGK